MTRKSRRELERAVAAASSPDRETSPALVYEHPETGERVDHHGRPVSHDAAPLMMLAVPSPEEFEAVASRL